MSVFSNIENALNTRLSTLSNSPTVAWPNVPFIPSENSTYIRPTLLPTATSLDTIVGMELHKGIYQVDVFVPLERGVGALNTILDNVESLYKSNKTLSNTDTIYIQAIGRGKAQRQDSWYVSYVEINYICYS